jgi:hypothetical protein
MMETTVVRLHIIGHNWLGEFDANDKWCQSCICDVHNAPQPADPKYRWQYLFNHSVDVYFPADKIPSERIPITVPITDGLFGDYEIRTMMDAHWDSEYGEVYPDLVMLKTMLNDAQFAEAQRVVQVAIAEYVDRCDVVEVPNG